MPWFVVLLRLLGAICGASCFPNGLCLSCFLSHPTQGMEVESNGQAEGKKIVRKPYVLNGQCCFRPPWGLPRLP